MHDATHTIIAAEREAHFDGDAWRSYCDAQMRERTPALPPVARQPFETCAHRSRSLWWGGITCCDCDTLIAEWIER